MSDQSNDPPLDEGTWAAPSHQSQSEPTGWAEHTHTHPGGAHSEDSPYEVTGTVEGVERALTTPPPPKPPRQGVLGWFDKITGRAPSGPTPEEQRLAQMIETIRTPAHNHRITVSTHKGGSGKTTTSLALGTVMSLHRPDQTVVIDSNPDTGTLASQLPGPRQHKNGMRELLANANLINSSQDIRQFTHLSPSRLEVLASDQDPYKARGVSPEDYDLVQRVLGTYRDIIVTDTGTDLTLPLFDEIIDYTDTLVISASTAVDDAKLAMHTLNTWYNRGTDGRGAALVPNAVVAIFQRTNINEQVELDWLVKEFSARARRVVVIPNDPALAKGGKFDWDRLQPATQAAYIELTAAVAEGFR